jgi:MFS family permease
MKTIEKKVTSLQAYILLFCGCMSVLAAVAIAPILPKIQEHFASIPNVKFLVPLSLTTPGLVVACLAPFVGAIADKCGRKNLLVFGLVLYCLFGVAPIFIDSLHYIIGTRVMVGVSEAIIMTCSIALIGDYFHGAKRERYLALNTTLSSTSAVIFIVIAGALGDHGWRTPFFLYGIAAILVVLSILFLWEPTSRGSDLEMDKAKNVMQEENWSLLLLLFICGVTLIGGIGFMGIQVHIGYLLGGVGTTSSSTIGMIASGGQMAVVLGSFVFRLLLKMEVGTVARLGIASLGLGIGYFIAGSATTQNGVIAGTVIAGLGGGIILPAMMCWNMNILPDSKRALGMGSWMSAFFLGQFLTPLVVVGLSEKVGSIAYSIHLMGIIILPIAVLLIAWQLGRRVFFSNKHIVVSS